MLGHCSSAERIDLTRFWNWQDAPSDTAPGIGMVQMPTTTPPLTTGVTAPNSLTNLPPLINNLITAPQPNTSLLQAMGQQAASQPDFNQSLTGQQQLASIMQNGQTLANSARSDALKASQTLVTQAMNTMSSLVGSAMGSQQPAGQQPPAGQKAPDAQAAGKAQTGGTPAKTGGTAAKTAGAAQPASADTGGSAAGAAATNIAKDIAPILLGAG